MTVQEKLQAMQNELCDLVRKLNKEGEIEGALKVQQTAVLLTEAMEGAQAFSEVEWDWEPESAHD